MSSQSLTLLKDGDKASVTLLQGGCGFHQRLRAVGIREGKILRMVASYPFSGPVVIEVDGRQITLGRGMAQRITVALEP
jgi:ferrous iron transport protein A